MNIMEMFKKDKEEKCNLPFGSDECGKYLRTYYKDSVNEAIILDESLYDYVVEYDDIVDAMSKLEIRKKTIEHRFQSEMKYNEVAFCKERKLTWKKVVKTTIDTKKLRSDMPQVAIEYAKTSESRVFKMR